jgi:hypothetical protein
VMQIESYDCSARKIASDMNSIWIKGKISSGYESVLSLNRQRFGGCCTEFLSKLSGWYFLNPIEFFLVTISNTAHGFIPEVCRVMIRACPHCPGHPDRQILRASKSEFASHATATKQNPGSYQSLKPHAIVIFNSLYQM